MEIRVIRTDRFLNKLKKIDKSYLDRVEKLIHKIILNPDLGKPMMYDRKGTRELYLSPFRLSYAYISYENKIILLDLYHKDEQ